MRITNNCKLFTAAGLALLTGGFAQAAPLTVIDTEQKAAAAALAVLEIPRGARAMTGGPINKLYNGLITVRRVATYADVANAPGGVTAPCEASGNINARLSPDEPGLLLLRWNQCREYGVRVHGFASIRLPSESLAPPRTSALVFGGTEDFIIQIGLQRDTYKFSMVGDIELMASWDASGNTVEHNAYEITGYRQSRELDHRFGYPPRSVRTTIANHLQETTDLTADRENYGMARSHHRVERGSLEFVEKVPAAQIDSRRRWVFRGYDRSTIEDLAAWTVDTSLSGRVQVRSIDHGTAGCLNGVYAFMTTAPLREQDYEGSYRGGELAINGSLAAGFSQGDVPQSYGVTLTVENVGTFAYQGYSTTAALAAPAGCAAP